MDRLSIFSSGLFPISANPHGDKDTTKSGYRWLRGDNRLGFVNIKLQYLPSLLQPNAIKGLICENPNTSLLLTFKCECKAESRKKNASYLCVVFIDFMYFQVKS